MKTSLFDYALPPDRIAQFPPARRGTTRLLMHDRASGRHAHIKYADIPEFVTKDDVIVLNRTKVVKARVHSVNPRNGKNVEVLFVELHAKTARKEQWKCLLGRAKDVAEGDRLMIGDDEIRIIGRIPNERYFLVETLDGFSLMDRAGETPLPPYIKRPATKDDIVRYNTVFAESPRSVAAPTASLNLTKKMLSEISSKGATIAYIDLAVGLGTFLPVVSENIEDHVMHSEWIQVGEDVVTAVNSAKGRIWAFGTTVVRALESAAVGPQKLATFEGYTNMFIYPGYKFKIVDVVVTNFHMPRSTLIMLVAAFMGTDAVKKTYAEALENGYQFLSYGDSMMAGDFPELSLPIT